MSHDVVPVLEDWYRFLSWLLDTTSKFPKNIRFTFSSRIDNLALDILEELIATRYSSRSQKLQLLQGINLKLEKLRFLVRLCFDRKYMNSQAYQHCCKDINEVGRQVGGWYKTLNNK